MGRYIAGRLLQAIPTLLGVLAAVFFIVRVLPGDPAAMLLGDFATAEAIQATRERLGLDKPIWVQFGEFLSGLARGDLGRSFSNRLPVTRNILDAAPHTLYLALGGLLLSVLMALPAGVLSAVKRGSVLDYGIMGLSLLGVSVPIFWLAILAILLFSISLGLLPVIGVGDPSIASRIRHLILPSLVLGINLAGLTARLTRSAVLNILSKDYLRTARAKGLSGIQVLGRHALRNAFIPIATILALNFASLIGGAVILETVFGRPGLGRVLVSAVLARDFPQIQGSVLFFAVTVVLINLIVDIAYSYLDPRIRYT